MGEETLVVCDEHPLRGLGGSLHNSVSEAALQLRPAACRPAWPGLVERQPSEVLRA
ncbi:hypothetical protein [Streptomyces virginiae]|uniref:hypothetical protein n=1 Tax=Streptomyces virginiae TaxID=1961 RepID=UPI002DBFCA71|nr:hypothetical protein [Streptomyces sp. CMAA1738]MEC4575095.1 hypothetical protein [Streptomyces sp. CMAA1738]